MAAGIRFPYPLDRGSPVVGAGAAWRPPLPIRMGSPVVAGGAGIRIPLPIWIGSAAGPPPVGFFKRGRYDEDIRRARWGGRR